MSDRIYVRQSLLSQDAFADAALAVLIQLEKRGIPYAMIGGMAVAHYANPPQTVDVDFLALMNRQESMHVLMQVLKLPGWEGHPIRLGKRENQPPGGIFFYPAAIPLRVDVLSAKGVPYLEQVIQNAVLTKVNARLEIPVVLPEDLIVLKVMAGRDKDLEDVAHVYRKLNAVLDHDYIDSTLDRFGYEGIPEA